MANAAKKSQAPTRGVPITDPSFVPQYDEDGIIINDPDALPLTSPSPARRPTAGGRAGKAASLSTFRKSLGLSQVELARGTGIDQAQVSRLEQPDADMMLSTLRKYIAGLGGELEMVVVKDGRRWTVKIG